MVCQRGGFIIQRHNELRDLEAEMLRMVCNDVEVEPVLQQVTGEILKHGTDKAPDARLDIHARGFWGRQRSAFFDVRVCHPNADSYRDLTPKQIWKKHENEKKRQYAERVMEIEEGTFDPEDDSQTLLTQIYRSKILEPARINLFFKELFKELGIQEYEILFLLTCFLFNIRDG